MTNNPLARRNSVVVQGLAFDSHPTLSAQEWCDQRNATMTRDDIEWVVGNDGQPHLQDRASWQAKHTHDLARKAERDRRDWMHRQNYPVTSTPSPQGEAS